MTYDWSGERTRRVRLLKVATAIVLIAIVIGIPLLMR
ncbi:hypothetical protein ABIE40_003068 [Rhizobium sp. OAE497]|jgi:hypothetical protein